MFRTPLAAAALAAAAVAAPAPAQVSPPVADAQDERRSERSERFYVSLWWLAPSEQPLGRRSVGEGDYVVRSRLLPSSLIRLTADAVAGRRARVVLPAGTQLFGLSTSGPPIWCALARRSSGASVRGSLLGGLVGARAPSQTCLTDLDKDGRLDAFFAAGSPVGGVPNFSGYRPRNPSPLTGAAFERLEPGQIETEYFVGIRYEGLSTIGANPAFSISFGNERNREALTQTVSAGRGTNLVSALGAEFEIVRRDGERLEVDVRRNMPRQPFHVMRTVRSR